MPCFVAVCICPLKRQKITPSGVVKRAFVYKAANNSLAHYVSQALQGPLRLMLSAATLLQAHRLAVNGRWRR